MKLLGYTITKAKTIKTILDRQIREIEGSPRYIEQIKLRGYVVGLYDARIFGLCIRRNKPVEKMDYYGLPFTHKS